MSSRCATLFPLFSGTKHPIAWLVTAATGQLHAVLGHEGLQQLVQRSHDVCITINRGRAARRMRIGDLVWMRHAKSGEVAEHLNEMHLVDGGRITQTIRTYRGEGMVF